MQIEKSFVVKAPADAVWDFLTDPYQVAKCLPGAAITDKVDEQNYGGTITVKVGPVTANYRGKMRFDRLDRAAGEAEIAASGQETRGKGGADMKMKSRVVEKAPGETEVTVVSDVNVVGMLAQFGRGMIQDVSDQLFQKFTDAMRRELETPAAAAPPPVSPPVAAEMSAVDAAPAPAAPAVAPAPVPPAAPPPAGEAALDIGSIGAAAAGRAAGRMLQRPGFWIAVVVLALLLYWFLR
ncbi:MAG TPA: SRPBCC family protein [Thermoanaerobaculia bacterium]